jgi:hypothetical protein
MPEHWWVDPGDPTIIRDDQGIVGRFHCGAGMCLPWWPSCWNYQANYGGNATASSMMTKWGAIRECRRWIDNKGKR